jgi:prepilin-type N-terminal cleavage/methylation domain-containing protein
MKNLLKTKKAEGFTIIEVMIVLAIAGLIMVIVFIAVPQLQRNQRDNARQNIVNRVEAEIQTYGGNNQGVYPFTTTGTGVGTWSDFYTRYIHNATTALVKVEDPSTGADVFTDTTHVPVAFTSALATAGGNPAQVRGDFAVVYGAACQGELLVQSGPSPALPTTRNFAVVIGLDRAGTRYCVDNG